MTSTKLVSYDVLQLQNADTSNAIIDYFIDHPPFQELSHREGTLIQIRDDEDEEKLKVGIKYAQDKRVIDVNYVPEPYVPIDVVNKTPEMVADTILQYVRDHPVTTTTDADTTATDTSTHGYVIVLVGLSGTGKGTTVTQLVSKLQQQDYNVITWSNGNIFRSVTLLATTYWDTIVQQQQQEQSSNSNKESLSSFNKDVVLTKENIELFMTMLSFEKNPTTHKYDIKVHGYHYDNCWISDIQNTLLKSTTVSKYIPTVAEVTQGEVINFAAKAVDIMIHESKLVVLLEGREQTVNYVRSPYRFELVLQSNPQLIGQRRAAQRIMAMAIADPIVTSVAEVSNVTTEMVETALLNAVHSLSQDL